MGSRASVAKGPVPIQGPIVPGAMAKNIKAKKAKKRRNGTTYAQDLVNNEKGRISEYVEDQNPKQLEQLAQLRELVDKMPRTGEDKCLFTDFDLMRFLNGFYYDVKKAAEIIQSFIEYRSKTAIELHTYDATLENKVKHYYQRNIYGTCHQGRPILIERLGSANFKKMFEICDLENFSRIYCHQNERLRKVIFPKCAEAAGRPIKDFIFLLDVGGMQQLPSGVKDFLQNALKAVSDWSPNTMALFLICNIPSKLLFFVNIFYSFLDGETKKKVKILKDLDRLQEFIDIDQLPDFLGGTNTVEDYGELFDIEKGPWVKMEAKKKKSMI